MSDDKDKDKSPGSEPPKKKKKQTTKIKQLPKDDYDIRRHGDHHIAIKRGGRPKMSDEERRLRRNEQARARRQKAAAEKRFQKSLENEQKRHTQTIKTRNKNYTNKEKQTTKKTGEIKTVTEVTVKDTGKQKGVFTGGSPKTPKKPKEKSPSSDNAKSPGSETTKKSYKRSTPEQRMLNKLKKELNKAYGRERDVENVKLGINPKDIGKKELYNYNRKQRERLKLTKFGQKYGDLKKVIEKIGNDLKDTTKTKDAMRRAKSLLNTLKDLGVYKVLDLIGIYVIFGNADLCYATDNILSQIESKLDANQKLVIRDYCAEIIRAYEIKSQALFDTASAGLYDFALDLHDKFMNYGKDIRG